MIVLIIRDYTDKDKEFIIGLASRFTEIDYLDFRNRTKMLKKQEEMALESVENNKSNIFIAEKDGQYLGYIELKDWVDYFTRERQGYVASLAVTRGAEGTGVGTLLLKKAEDWAKQKGYKELVLQVFTANQRAIKLYESLGYEPDISVMVKQI